MAHAFDNRNFIPGKQQTFYSVVSPSSRPDITNVLWETSSSSSSPKIQSSLSSSPQASPKPNHPPPSYEESIFNKALANRQSSRSSLHSPSFNYYSNHQQQNSPNPTMTPFISYSLPSTPSESNHYQRQHSTAAEGYYSFVSPHRSSDTKPPPPARIPKVTSTTTNNTSNTIHRTNVLPQCSPSGMKTTTTYLNTTQLYLTQPSSRDQPMAPPPPPPPRYPLHPPVIPPRGSPICHQSNSVIISDFNASASPKPTSQVVYRSPVLSSTVKRNNIADPHTLESQFHSLSINNHHKHDTMNGQIMREYSIGHCRKCGEIVANSDDACDIDGQIYHSFCAVCVLCGRSVKSKHFFVKDQLYCEEDFLYTGFHQTLEHCIACGHLITDTILQALGQSYHLTCFKCSKCSICLDGIPFITDKNQNFFCLHDYHMTYGPRCDKCSNPICPEDGSNETVRIISMGKTFHVQCYQCQDCSLQLNDEPDRRCYPLGDILLCQACCRRRIASMKNNL
ncbi:unnamed protein product [Rotaria magnacalcarata]|uniref:LIM zinc-binding domain-containing protein n=1 Tax=Rotaria magnacalcarata TaxID=392030 RepID=A0A816M544_9BILA|nr:unnamed protein product [Rotaria magnacalcarata]CAF4120800.1 unnamed protein product [Rotaria magnacalcarata]